MAIYRCSVCDTLYDEEKDGRKWEELPEDWVCPVCESGKSYWSKVEEGSPILGTAAGASGHTSVSPDEYRRLSDDLEIHMADIHALAETGKPIIEPMRTKKPAPCPRICTLLLLSICV